MSIEFRCTNCDKLLRTQAGTEGKKAKCPQCGTVLTIPAADAPPRGFDAPPPREPDFGAAQRESAATFVPPREDEFAPVAPSASFAASDNPYQSPTAYTEGHDAAAGPLRPTRIELGETLAKTWEIFKGNPAACIGGSLIFLGCNFAVGAVSNVVVSLGLAPLADNGNTAMFVVLWILQQLVGQAIGAFFWIGLILFMLRVARRGDADFSLLFAGGPLFVSAAILQIVWNLAIFAGFVLLIVPGFIFGLMLSQALCLLADRRTSVGESLNLSIALMKGNKLTVLAIWVIVGGLGIVVGLFTCLLGFPLLVVPFGSLLMAVIYLGVSGQPTIVDRAPGEVTRERGFDAPPAQPV